MQHPPGLRNGTAKNAKDAMCETPNPKEPNPNHQMESTWNLGVRSWWGFGFWLLGFPPSVFVFLSYLGI